MPAWFGDQAWAPRWWDDDTIWLIDVENVVGRVWTGTADDDLYRLWDLYTAQHRHGG
ncbi:hypothetical protein [Frankia sp. Cas4]|uniref:hypothetical protein n=1 Tax=Frankia sp. Cas4 TaxID=3073927 RepID=UPI002AD4E4B4|nr:hypothetical protein [Frankia sp. Cas4]